MIWIAKCNHAIIMPFRFIGLYSDFLILWGLRVMVFSSATFLFLFLPIVLIVSFILRENKYTNIWLLFVSLIFFGWSQPQYIWIILVSILLNYSFALFIDKSSGNFKRVLLVLSVCGNLGLLFYFKYFNFAVDSINSLLRTSFSWKEIILPIGISFFTFQGMSYVIDVFRGQVKVQKNPLKVALYIVLFPQLIAGPIVRYKDIEREIDTRVISTDEVYSGLIRFTIGLGKKAILANTFAEVADNIWKAGVDNNTVIIAWVGSIAYSLQIFYDFSGYSDMAIGIGRALGFHFLENFDRPYISKNITEFWRRWHISLSSWFRDYVYIPLGGNKKHLYRNLLIVFLLTGMWHGASWHFFFWGAYNALFILIERYLKGKNITISSHIYAFLAVNAGWVLFRADNMTAALKYLGTMVGIGTASQPGFTVGWYVNRWVITLFIVAVMDILGLFGKLRTFIMARAGSGIYSALKTIMVFALLLLSVMRIMSGTYNPFIYFQF